MSEADEHELMTKRTSGWVLLAEDDKLFVALFSRFWSDLYPSVPLLITGSVAQGQALLRVRQTQPLVAVLDHHLCDGSSEALKAELHCPVLVWSAVENGELQRKPQGRQELVAAVERIGKLGSIDVS